MSVFAAALVAGPLPQLPTGVLVFLALTVVVLSLWWRELELPLHLIAALLLAAVAWWAEDRIWWISLFAGVSLLGTFWAALLRSRRRTNEAETKADQLAVQVDRRISELFSLQELSYVLSRSIQLDRVVDQVAKYAARFLQAEGAIVALVEMEGKMLRVVAASGTLESLVGQVSEDSESALVRFAIGRDRIEVAQGVETPTVKLIGGTMVRSAAVAPLRAQGITMGALVVRLDQSQRVLRLTAAPLAGVEPGSAVILIEDVTEQRMLEAQIIQNDKMASIGQLVSGVAHELNNPLTSISGLAELLLERPPHPELPREHLRVIHDQAERAGRIVRNLLTFARKGVPEKTAVDLNDVVTRTSLLIVYELQLHGIELESKLSPDPVVVLGDRYELQQVLLNLVTNAVQAVAGLEPGHSRRITLATSRLEAEAVLQVRDSGPGVPKHLAPYLFTPFFTTKPPGEGTGLGLSLSYGLVKAHGGDLSYEPSPEGGAEFRVTLPLYEAELPLEGVSAGATNGRRVARRILVVDEDPAVHRLVSALFAPEGHAIESVRSGEQALKLAQEGEYDMIIADVRVATGAAQPFTNALLNACPHTQNRLVIACSGDEDLPLALTDHPVRRLRKPFNPRDLRTLAREILQ